MYNTFFYEKMLDLNIYLLRNWYIPRQLRLNHDSYSLLLALLASYSYQAVPLGKLNIFYRPLAAHRYLAGPLGQLKIIGRAKAANIQFWYLRFEKPYMTAAQVTSYLRRIIGLHEAYLSLTLH